MSPAGAAPRQRHELLEIGQLVRSSLQKPLAVDSFCPHGKMRVGDESRVVDHEHLPFGDEFGGNEAFSLARNVSNFEGCGRVHHAGPCGHSAEDRLKGCQ